MVVALRTLQWISQGREGERVESYVEGCVPLLKIFYCIQKGQ